MCAGDGCGGVVGTVRGWAVEVWGLQWKCGGCYGCMGGAVEVWELLQRSRVCYGTMGWCCGGLEATAKMYRVLWKYGVLRRYGGAAEV